MKFPPSLKCLEFGEAFDFLHNVPARGEGWLPQLKWLQVDFPATFKARVLPDTLTELSVTWDTDRFEVDAVWPLHSWRLPSRLMQLKFSDWFNSSLDGIAWPPHSWRLPSRLMQLKFSDWFNSSLDGIAWPPHLETLIFGHQFDQSLVGGVLPLSLRVLDLGEGFDQPLVGVDWPPKLEELVFGHYFRQDLRNVVLPQELRRLDFGASFCLLHHPRVWPPYLDELQIDQLPPQGHTMHALTLPNTLRHLRFLGAALKAP
eukprot:s863_g43.t1